MKLFYSLDVRCPRSKAAVVALSIALICGCGKKHKRVTTVPSAHPQPPQKQVAIGYAEEGIASWYGVPFHGRQAADGEIYNMESLVAAHRTLPFHTWLKVTNLSNGRSVQLRVIDRGPFIDGRIIDLSKAAAREIGLLGPGVGRVRIEVIGAPPDVPGNDFYAVQVGAFSVQANAERARDDYARRYGTAQLAARRGNTTLWRVLVGKETSIAAAQQLAAALAKENRDVFVVRLDQVKPEQP